MGSGASNSIHPDVGTTDYNTDEESSKIDKVLDMGLGNKDIDTLSYGPPTYASHYTDEQSTSDLSDEWLNEELNLQHLGLLSSSQDSGISSERSSNNSIYTTEQSSYTARENFTPLSDKDLPFTKGDPIQYVSKSENPDKFVAMNTRTGQMGEIHNSDVTDDNDVNNAVSRFVFNVTRQESNMLLGRPGVQEGTYLVRTKQGSKGFSLSIRTKGGRVKHFHIVQNDGAVYLYFARQFANVDTLIQFYTATQENLCTKLTEPLCNISLYKALDDIKVPRNEIKILSKLDAGSFGIVYKGKLSGKRTVAIKQTRNKDTTSVDVLVNEIRLLHELRHRHIVQLVGVHIGDELMCIMEHMAQGDLWKLLRNDKGVTIKERDLVLFALQIADGMAFMESRSFVHRDLRASNVLLTEDNICKIADFGQARFVEGEYRQGKPVYRAHKKSPMAVKWMAPESLKERIYTCKSDVWSFGILMYELVTYGRNPYPDMSPRSVPEAVLNGYRMPRPEGDRVKCTDQIWNLATKCWAMIPERRPTFKFLHNTFDEILFDLHDQ